MLMHHQISDRDRERDDTSSIIARSIEGDDRASITSLNTLEIGSNRQRIDILFDKTQDRSSWDPPKPPQVLGELLDSRFMLPLQFPSNPRLLAALPSKSFLEGTMPTSQPASANLSPPVGRGSLDFVPSSGHLPWRSRNSKIRAVGVGILRWVDGATAAARWSKSVVEPVFEIEEDSPTNRLEEGGEEDEQGSLHTIDDGDRTLRVATEFTPITRKPSVRKGRASLGEVTPVDTSFVQKN